MNAGRRVDDVSAKNRTKTGSAQWGMTQCFVWMQYNPTLSPLPHSATSLLTSQDLRPHTLFRKLPSQLHLITSEYAIAVSLGSTFDQQGSVPPA